MVAFGALPEDVIRAIMRKELEEVGRREGVARAGIQLVWSERLIAHLARVGFDHRYGARPLQRTLERLVVAPLARFLLGAPALAKTRLHAESGQARGRVLYGGVAAGFSTRLRLCAACRGTGVISHPTASGRET